MADGAGPAARPPSGEITVAVGLVGAAGEGGGDQRSQPLLGGADVGDAPRDKAASLSAREKLRLQLGLLRYVLPLVLVYWAEYACQSGACTAFALPATQLPNKDSRKRAYQYFNLFYQVGGHAPLRGPAGVPRAPSANVSCPAREHGLPSFPTVGRHAVFSTPTSHNPHRTRSACSSAAPAGRRSR